jgi:hypothetical protein
MNQVSSSCPDLMILGANNTDVQRQQIGVARACQPAGLSVQFLAEDLSAPKGTMAAPYRRSGFEVFEIPCKTWRTGPLAYPSAPGQVRLLASWSRVLSRSRPRLILTHADRGGTWGVLQEWAKKNRVTGVVLQEGVSARSRGGFAVDPASMFRGIGSRILRTLWRGMLENRVGSYLYADHALVWGEAMRRELIAAGRPPGTVHVVGNPQFDHVSGMRPLAAHELRTVLFAQQYQPNEATEQEACRLLVMACADDVGCRLLFRPHPRGHMTRDAVMEMAAATAAPDLVEVADGPEVGEYVSQASVLVTYYSTMAYHAALQGIPLLLLDWVSPLYQMDAPEYGAALSVKDPAALASSLRRILDDVGCRQRLHEGMSLWLLDHLGPLDGRSSLRSAETLARLAALAGPGA